MTGLSIPFRLPLADWPLATFESDYLFEAGRVVLDGEPIVVFEGRSELVRGVRARFAGHEVSLVLTDPDAADAEGLELEVDGAPAVREDRLSVRPSRSAWVHAFLALFASFAGFVASWLYLDKAKLFEDAWAMKMGIHTAGWHLLLTLTLFPASVWGQRLGIRAVQLVSFIFFGIHAGIAIANTTPDATSIDGPWIALFNALSGVFFLAAVVYGQRAHRDMNPLRALGPRPRQR